MAKPHARQELLDKLLDAVKPTGLLAGTSLEDDLYYQVDSLTSGIVFTTSSPAIAEAVYNFYKNDFNVRQAQLFSGYSISVEFKTEDMFKLKQTFGEE